MFSFIEWQIVLHIEFSIIFFVSLNFLSIYIYVFYTVFLKVKDFSIHQLILLVKQKSETLHSPGGGVGWGMVP